MRQFAVSVTSRAYQIALGILKRHYTNSPEKRFSVNFPDVN